MGNYYYRGSAMICCITLLAIFCLLSSMTRVDAWDEGISKGAMERNRAKSCVGDGGHCNPPESNKYHRGCTAEERCREGSHPGEGGIREEGGVGGRKLEEEEDVTVSGAAADDDDDDDDTFKPATASFSGSASFESSFIVMGH